MKTTLKFLACLANRYHANFLYNFYFLQIYYIYIFRFLFFQLLQYVFNLIKFRNTFRLSTIPAFFVSNYLLLLLMPIQLFIIIDESTCRRLSACMYVHVVRHVNACVCNAMSWLGLGSMGTPSPNDCANQSSPRDPSSRTIRPRNRSLVAGQLYGCVVTKLLCTQYFYTTRPAVSSPTYRRATQIDISHSLAPRAAVPRRAAKFCWQSLKNATGPRRRTAAVARPRSRAMLIADGCRRVQFRGITTARERASRGALASTVI